MDYSTNNKIRDVSTSAGVISPLFIRISNDVIINLSDVSCFTKEYEQNTEYEEYYANLQDLLKSVIEQYMKENIDILDNDKTPEEISSELYSKFYPIVQKNMVKEYGEMPEPYIENYKVILRSGQTYYIADEVFYQICNLIGIDMSKEFKIYD